MQKNEIFLTIEKYDKDFEIYYIAAWEEGFGEVLTEEHLCEIFPELEDLELADLSEGELEYSGTNLAELIEKLEAQGFHVSSKISV